MGSRRLGLSVKFVLLIAVYLTVLFAIFSAILVRLNVRTFSNNLNQETRSFTQLATQPIGDTFLTYQDSGRIRIAQRVQRFVDLDPNITNVSVTDLSGEIHFSQQEEQMITVNPENAASFVPVYETNERGNIERAVVPHFEDSGVHRFSIVYDISDQTVVETINRQISLIVVLGLTGMLISVLGLYWLVEKFFLRSIKSLSQQAQDISRGRFDVQIEADRSDEVGDLAVSLNQMAASLKEDIKKLQEIDELKSEFLTIVSHNLRTPLTILRGYLDNADEIKSMDKMQEVLGKLKYGSDRLSDFAEDVIMIAELEAGEKVGNRHVTDLKDLLRDLAGDYTRQAEAEDITFVNAISSESQRVMINKSLVAGAIENLLDNALKFTEAGGRIELSTKVMRDTVEVTVSDTGTGIERAELPKLFTKFHRGTSTVEYDYEGTGIGLYSSYLIVKQHGGDIRVKSRPKKGSDFTVILPLVKPDNT